MGPNSSYFELKYHDGTIYEGSINTWFIFVYKGVLVIMKSCIGDSEQGL